MHESVCGSLYLAIRKINRHQCHDSSLLGRSSCIDRADWLLPHPNNEAVVPGELRDLRDVLAKVTTDIRQHSSYFLAVVSLVVAVILPKLPLP